MPKARVLLADDNAPMLEKVASLLATRYDIVGAVSDGQSAVDAAARLQPDLVVLDISMPVMDGIRAAQRLKELDPHARIVFLTVDRDPDLRQSALETGALGYVTKPRLAVDLIHAIELALRGRSFASPDLD